MKKHPIALPFAAALCLAALAASLPARAQGAIKPLEALVVNPESRPVPVLDTALAAAVRALTPARTPYQRTTRFNQGLDTCTQFVCEVTFPAVPAGKRLLVKHASAVFGAPAVNGFPRVELRDSRFDSEVVTLPLPMAAPSTGAQSTYVVSSPVTFHVEAGRSPVLALLGVGVGTASLTATVSIVGELVDAN